MSKFSDLWELQQSFTNSKQLKEWLMETFDSAAMVFMTLRCPAMQFTYSFSLADYCNSNNYCCADEARRTRTGEDHALRRDDADIYWKHLSWTDITLNHEMHRCDVYTDCHGTIIISTKEGHYVFTRKADPYPKPASRQ